MDHQIIRSLFRACIEAAMLLDIDVDFAAVLQEQVAKIAPNQIGRTQGIIGQKQPPPSHPGIEPQVYCPDAWPVLLVLQPRWIPEVPARMPACTACPTCPGALSGGAFPGMLSRCALLEPACPPRRSCGALARMPTRMPVPVPVLCGGFAGALGAFRVHETCAGDFPALRGLSAFPGVACLSCLSRCPVPTLYRRSRGCSPRVPAISRRSRVRHQEPAGPPVLPGSPHHDCVYFHWLPVGGYSTVSRGGVAGPQVLSYNLGAMALTELVL